MRKPNSFAPVMTEFVAIEKVTEDDIARLCFANGVHFIWGSRSYGSLRERLFTLNRVREAIKMGYRKLALEKFPLGHIYDLFKKEILF